MTQCKFYLLMLRKRNSCNGGSLWLPPMARPSQNMNLFQVWQSKVCYTIALWLPCLASNKRFIVWIRYNISYKN